MRILYVTPELPYPLTSGLLRHYHLVKGLHEHHRVTLVSLTGRAVVDATTEAALLEICDELHVVSPPSLGERLPSLGRHGGVLRRQWATRRLARCVKGLVAGGGFDVAVLSGKQTHPIGRSLRPLPIVTDVCDATSLRLAGEMAHARPLRRGWLALRWLEVRRVERILVRRSAIAVFATERDRRAVVGDGGGEVVPQGVDLALWTPAAVRPRPARLLFTGVMSYRPNHDAAMLLIREVLPLVRGVVPDADLVIAGRDPLPELLAATRTGGISVTGSLADLRPVFEEATVYCAPLRFASGVQNKVLEAMAMHVPAVTSSVVAGGLESGGKAAPVEVAPDAAEMAAAIVRLLGDRAERERRAVAGRQFVEQYFCWERSVSRLEELCRRAAATDSASGLVAGLAR